jgi:hypothetical protein
LNIGSDEYAKLHDESEAITPELLIALLGLNHQGGEAVARYGCVPYSLAVEEDRVTPSYDAGVEYIAAANEGRSFIMASHIFRLMRHPFCDERLNKSENEALTFSTQSHQPSKDMLEAQSTHVQGIAIGKETVGDMLDYLNRVKVAASQNNKPSVNVHFRYAPVAVKSNKLGLPNWFFRVLPRSVQLRLATVESAHSNFYATIEFGRLLTILIAHQKGVSDFNASARRLIEEADQLRQRQDEFALIPRPSTAGGVWNAAESRGPRFADLEVRGNNLIAATNKHTADPYLAALLNLKVVGSARRRFVINSASDLAPLSYFTVFQPIAFRGTGSIFTPHIGLTSMQNYVRIGDNVELFQGAYGPFALADIKGTEEQGITISAKGYGDIADFDEVRQLTNEERAQLDRVIISGNNNNNQKVNVLIDMKNCSHVQLHGLELTGAAVAVQTYHCLDVSILHSRIHSDIPASSDTAADVAPRELNDITTEVSNVWSTIRARQLPRFARWFGYFWAFGLFVMFMLITLFEVLRWSVPQAGEWFARSVITLGFNIVLLVPLAYLFRETVTTVTQVTNGPSQDRRRAH